MRRAQSIPTKMEKTCESEQNVINTNKITKAWSFSNINEKELIENAIIFRPPSNKKSNRKFIVSNDDFLYDFDKDAPRNSKY